MSQPPDCFNATCIRFVIQLREETYRGPFVVMRAVERLICSDGGPVDELVRKDANLLVDRFSSIAAILSFGRGTSFGSIRHDCPLEDSTIARLDLRFGNIFAPVPPATVSASGEPQSYPYHGSSSGGEGDYYHDDHDSSMNLHQGSGLDDHHHRRESQEYSWHTADPTEYHGVEPRYMDPQVYRDSADYEEVYDPGHRTFDQSHGYPQQGYAPQNHRHGGYVYSYSENGDNGEFSSGGFEPGAHQSHGYEHSHAGGSRWDQEDATKHHGYEQALFEPTSPHFESSGARSSQHGFY